MGFTQFIFSRQFLKQSLFAALLTIVLVSIVILSLKGYTRHGRETEMPLLLGYSITDALQMAEETGFELVVTDSVYADDQPGGTVLLQDPEAGSMIKKGRKVYVTMVALSLEQVPIPELTDYSLRQAIAMLETYGLAVDSLVFVPDVGKTVIEARLGDQAAPAGMLVPKGTAIVLVVGRGTSNERLELPFLIGKTREEASRLLARAYLNVGAEFFPEGSDSTHLIVSRQKPAYLKRLRVPLGTAFDLWYENAADFNLGSALQQMGIDSLEADSLMRSDSLKMDTTIFEF